MYIQTETSGVLGILPWVEEIAIGEEACEEHSYGTE